MGSRQERTGVRRLGAAWRRAATPFAAVFCIFLSACERPAAPALPAPFRPDIYLVVIDCLRADHVGAYGYPLPTTPNLDALAREGLRFDTAYTNATWTKPSMATLFSGRYPSEHGLLKVGAPPSDEIETDVFPDSVPTLAEALRSAGYRTIASVNQVHLGPDLGFGRGLDDYRWARGGRSASEVNEHFAAALATIPPGQPVYGWVHYIDAHWPYRSGRKEPIPALGDTAVSPMPPKDQSRDVIAAWTREHLDERNRRGLMARYDREVRAVDEAFGALVELLKKSGRYDDALIVVTSDHGEGFFEHGRLLHGFEPYEEVARVPLVMKVPKKLRLTPGPRSTAVSHVDFAPTLLDLLELPPFPDASGLSYLEVLRGVEDADRPVLLQAELSSALRRGDLKLLLRLDGTTELYDLASDPGERHDLARDGCDARCAALHAELATRLSQLKASPAGRRAPLASEDVETLRSLGYL